MRLNEIEIKGTLLEEQETVIQWYRGDDVRIYTCDPTVLTKLKKVLEGKYYELERVTSRSVQLICHFNDITLIGKKRTISDETREKLGNHLRKVVEAHSNVQD